MVQEETMFNPEELKKRFNPEGSLIRRHQLKMLEMVKELDRICKKHNIPYFLYGGTLLGAIRHNGFIPWDDDLDVGLLRKDYVKLMKVLPQELPKHIALQTNETDKNYFYFFAKLRDKRSLLDEGNAYERYFKERGVFVDIFPFDNQRAWVHFLGKPMQGYAYKISRAKNFSDSDMRKIRIITKFNRLFSFPILRFISHFMRGKIFTYDYGIPFHIFYKEKDVFPLAEHIFEDMILPIPGNSHQMLQTQYGDYMQMPDLDSIKGGHVNKLEIYQ